MTLTSENPQIAARVLVVGGRGFVGSHVVRHLIAGGVPVHVFSPAMDMDLLADVTGKFEETTGSVVDRSAILAAIEASGATAILNTAAYGEGGKGLMQGGEANADLAMAINVDGYRHVLEAAHEAGVSRVLNTGSSVVFGPADLYGGAVDEDASRRPRTIYGLTKVIGEDLGQYYRDRHDLDVSSIRLPLVLGPGLWYQGAASALTSVIKAAGPGVTHAVSFHDARVDLMHVDDVAAALVAALLAPDPLEAIYHINGFAASMSEIIAAAVALVPSYAVEHDVTPPAMIFPLMDDSRFRTRFEFTPNYDLAGLVRAQISGEVPP